MFLLLDIEGKLSTENILGATRFFYVLGCSYGSVASFSSPCSHMSTPAHGKRVTVHSDGLNSKSFPLWLSSEPNLYFSGGRKHTKKKGHRFMLVSFFNLFGVVSYFFLPPPLFFFHPQAIMFRLRCKAYFSGSSSFISGYDFLICWLNFSIASFTSMLSFG